jgi:hypothetical protein
MIAESEKAIAQTQTSFSSTLEARKKTLLPEEAQKILPPLYAQEKKGGMAVAYIKMLSPSSSWSWWITEGQNEGEDFIMFGLVEGFEKELGYISLNELASVTGPMGLPIERDLHFTPTTLKDIAPELFRDNEEGR